MSEYGSKVLYPHIPAGNAALPVNNMPGEYKLYAGTKNGTAGQYKSGDIIVSLTGAYGNSNLQIVNTRRTYQRVSVSANNGAMCLLLVPHNWLTSNLIFSSQYGIDIVNNTYNEPPFSYELWLLHNQSSFAVSGTLSKNVENRVYIESGKSVDGYPNIGNVGSASQSLWTGGNTLIYDIENANGLVSAKLTYNSTDYYLFPDFVRTELNSQLEVLRQNYSDVNSVLNLKLARYGGYSEYTGSRPSLQVQSSLPIFSWTDLDAVYRYFKFGDIDGLNNDDLKLSEVDFRTDWTIYVNGARKPSIYITMESPGVDQFVSSNQAGYNKSDFIVQYRYPVYKTVPGTGSPSSGLGQFENTGLVNDSDDSYNNTRSTSYNEITQKNYPEVSFSDLDRGDMTKYAQYQFRIALADNPENYFSSWCEFGIGLIGSPTVADFAYMQNYGNVVSLDDGSTVTIIYDQVPDDVDDYEDPDDEFEDDTEPTGFSMTSALTTTYKVALDQLQLLGDELWNKTFIQDIHLINNSPIENIVSCKRLPFDLYAGVSRSIVLGNITNLANGNIVTDVPIIDVGTVTYHGYYNNFMDYSPYTRIILFLPFCGFVDLDASVVTDKTMSVKYAVDIILGKCKAMIYINGSYYMSVDGDCGIDIPLVASNRAQAESAFAIQGLESAMQGDALGVLGAAVSTQYHSSRNGSYTPTCAWQETRKCFMIADIPTVQYPSSYAHDIGYPCMLTRTLATMSGFTVCTSDIDMSGFSCTSEEMDMIKQILTTGIYL